MFNNWFHFRAGRAQGLGVGAEGMALEKTQSSPLVDGFLVPRYAARASLSPVAGAQVDFGHKVLPVSIVGNGAFVQGQLALQALATRAKG